MYKKYLIVFLGLIILNLALFSLNLNDFFVSDDFDLIYTTNFQNKPLLEFFTSNDHGLIGAGGSYRPMYNVAFWFNYHIWGLNPAGFHLFNLIFHIGVCCLVYLIAMQLFIRYKDKNKIAILSAIFFSILPNHTEAVVWISAIGDPMGSFFYLLAFYCYLLFKNKKQFYLIIISILSFILALLSKEFTLTLPILIIVWELYEVLRLKKLSWFNVVYLPIGYFILLVGYFAVRFNVTGLLFGYYAAEKFQLDLWKIFNMFISLVLNLFFYGQLRVIISNFFFNNNYLFAFLLISLMIGLFIFLQKYWLKLGFLIDTYIIFILPALMVSFSLMTDEGERYNYLPSVAFCWLLALVCWQVKKFWRSFVIALLIIYFAIFLIYKNYNWSIAAQITEKIILQDFPQIVDLNQANQKLIFVSLPDNFEGAQVFRTSIVPAINLYYPDFKFEGTLLNAYITLNQQNKDQKIMYWGSYPTGGYIAETYDQKNRVVGFDYIDKTEYTYELWNYDYNNFNSNTIRLILKNPDGSFIPAGQEDYQLLIFNNGQLKLLKITE